MFPVDIIDQPPRRVAAIAHTGPYPEIGGAFEKLSAIISARGLWPAVRGGVAVYYDDPAAVEAAALRSHAGFVLDEAAAMPAGLDEVRLAAGPAAVLHFKGPYAGLEAAYSTSTAHGSRSRAGSLPTRRSTRSTSTAPRTSRPRNC